MIRDDVLMMSESAKRIEASTLCSSELVEPLNLDHAHTDGNTEHDRSATEDAQECRGVPPVGSARRRPKSAPRRFETLLQFKGFAGGVPLNTERTTVKPWVGIAR